MKPTPMPTQMPTPMPTPSPTPSPTPQPTLSPTLFNNGSQPLEGGDDDGTNANVVGFVVGVAVSGLVLVGACVIAQRNWHSNAQQGDRKRLISGLNTGESVERRRQEDHVALV